MYIHYIIIFKDAKIICNYYYFVTQFNVFITLVPTGIVAEVHIMFIIVKKNSKQKYCTQKKFQKINPHNMGI